MIWIYKNIKGDFRDWREITENSFSNIISETRESQPQPEQLVNTPIRTQGQCLWVYLTCLAYVYLIQTRLEGLVEYKMENLAPLELTLYTIYN